MIWDNHACLPMDPQANLRFLGQLGRFRSAGADVISLNIGYGEMALSEHIRLAVQMRRWIAARPERFVLVETEAGAAAVAGSGRLGVVFDMEGAAPLAGRLHWLERLRALGVRWILIAYNRANAFGSGCHDAIDEGLTAEGITLIDRMEQVGMAVCLSHTSYRTAFEALDRARRPVVFSHSNPRALHDHPRNIPDDLIRACAASGGVVGVNGLGLFLGGEGAAAARAADHIDHIVQLVGVDHVGLGLDFVFDLAGLEIEKAAMANTFPPGLGYEAPTRCLGPEDIPRIAAILRTRGYDERALGAVMGGNWLRIARACWTPKPH
jgi:membrane dipeptidase